MGEIQDDSIERSELSSSYGHTEAIATYGSFPSEKDLKMR